ncbi:ERF family protein [Brevundimonas sp. 2R-24]|uniref:ERF family protein n=1 Tax=Peiella sedimenti TaxID=3061083 RepID=A0ABT8SP77_9CAUL|nr:ERF family protein [Caulobacteraceae bacterium XZ-24]
MSAEPIQGELVDEPPAESRAVSLPAAATPMEMLNAAVSQGAGVDVLEKLLALQERWEAGQARKAFDAAVAAAKGEIPPIVKNREVDFTTQKGRTNYRHESLDEIERVVAPILTRHGLSYRFRSKQGEGRLTVTCILSHRDGYFEETDLSAGNDTSGNKNDIQAIGSTATYLQRYTLKLALGLSTTTDDDGRAAGESAAVSAATAAIEACETLEALTAWKAANESALNDLPTPEADAIVAAFNERRRAIRDGAQ